MLRPVYITTQSVLSLSKRKHYNPQTSTLLTSLSSTDKAMESSSTEEALSESEKHRHLPLPATVEPLQRMGSGASAIVDAESRKLPSSQYKGVVSQPNGRWGAQIYEKHQRVWLGTFADEAEAARAYDVAVQRFRGRDAVTNFKPLSFSDDDDGASELLFLAARSKAEIVDMLRKHTYRDELRHSRRAQAMVTGGAFAGKKATMCSSEVTPELLFDKMVTPSDVGKLNRLVIPKQHAEKHLPLKGGGSSAACKGVLLNFEDTGGKVWNFRYSYWNSSQSYVLTKGWSRFVKEKGLRPGDVVSFWRSTGPERQLYIDRKPAPVAASGCAGLPISCAQVVRLFGVNILEVKDGNGGGGEDGKRSRDLGRPFSSMELYKKLCIRALS